MEIINKRENGMQIKIREGKRIGYKLKLKLKKYLLILKGDKFLLN